MWLQDAVHAIPKCMGRLAESGQDSSFDFLCQLSLPDTNLALLDQHELSKHNSALARQHLFNHGIHGLANCPTRKARSFLRQLVASGSCKDYRFTHGETYQSYAERTLHELSSDFVVLGEGYQAMEEIISFAKGKIEKKFYKS